jgi:cytoskeletal protein CcmA (bactofilin family)
MFGKKSPQAGIEQTKLATLIAQDIRITGDIEFADGLRIDGQVHGNVTSAAGAKTLLVLSETGAIDGDVHGYDIVVNGRVIGDIVADHYIELKANAQVTGNIRYLQLQMECGASVEGTLTKRDAAVTLALPEPQADPEASAA